ncbi:MAG: Gliding motility-associated ABC transporter substrate-binding protein GldG [Nitrospira sp.]|jgi:ABC-type uncharacterized transport system involved in gliding motility auxiliary subunit|nr:MAG: Gliding motility-associated ABC transporter substrate-binding protein GldG [Nitrospira sp.]
MEMSRNPLPIGAVGAGLAVAGLIAYSLVPEKLWLVTLLEGSALACLIWFFVTRFERLKKLSAQRSTRMGANSALMVALFVAILAIINFLAARHSVRWDFSENQNYTLAPETHRVLRGLTRDVNVTVFTREKDPGYQAYKERFDSYRQASPKLTVQFIDPERQPKVAQNYGITRTDIAIFESGPQSVRITSPAEVEITGALLRVSRDSKKRLVFLEGHGERSLEDKDRGGLAMTKEVLQKQGYDIGTVTLLQESAVPENTDVLIIAGPRRAVTQEEQERIRTYVAKGGHLMVLVDPDTQANIDDLLGTWGLELGRGVLVDLQDRLAQGDLTALLVRTFTDHEITHELTAAVLFPLARHLVFHEDKGKDWDYVPLARTSPRSWAETDIKGRVVSYNEKEDIQGPLALAAALTPKQAPDEGKPRPALIIVGNSAFASNSFINFPGNSDFFQRSIGWLTEERDLISLTPKDPALRPFVPNPLQERILLYVQVIFLPAMTFLSGLLVWRKRRRL